MGTERALMIPIGKTAKIIDPFTTRAKKNQTIAIFTQWAYWPTVTKKTGFTPGAGTRF
jgi:hypothetical protein